MFIIIQQAKTVSLLEILKNASRLGIRQLGEVKQHHTTNALGIWKALYKFKFFLLLPLLNE